MENTFDKRERAILAGLSANSMDEHERSSEISMEELAALVDTAGGDTVAMIMQNRPTPDPRSFIGDGKVREMKELVSLRRPISSVICFLSSVAFSITPGLC